MSMTNAVSPPTSSRCVIFFFEGYLGVSPTNVNLAKALGAAGYEVTIYSTPTGAPDAGDLGDVHVVTLRASRLAELVGKLGVGRFRLGRIVGRLAPTTPATLFALRALLKELVAAARDPSRTVYVGVDRDGVIPAWLAARVLKRHYVFLSLELKTTAEERRGLRAALIRSAYKGAAAVLTQGSDRLEILTRDHRWAHPKVFILPNAPFADDAPREPSDSYLRTVLQIPPRRRIALAAGMIEDVTCSADLAKGFAGISDWALVLHERTKRSPDEPYLAALRAANPDNLYLSLNPVPYDQIDRVFASADVGLAFYQPDGPDDVNFKFISSSGKLPHYLKYGKPVLVSNLPPLVEVVDEFRCGIVIKDPSDSAEIGAALAQITVGYEEFSRNAFRCFRERYEFGKAADPLLRFVSAL